MKGGKKTYHVDNKKAITTTKQEKELLVLKKRPCQDDNEDDSDSECFISEQLSTVLLQIVFDNMNLACSLMLVTPELERKRIL